MNQLYIEITENLRIINESGAILKKAPEDIIPYVKKGEIRISIHNGVVNWNNIYVGIFNVDTNHDFKTAEEAQSAYTDYGMFNFINWTISHSKEIISEFEKDLSDSESDLQPDMLGMSVAKAFKTGDSLHFTLASIYDESSVTPRKIKRGDVMIAISSTLLVYRKVGNNFKFIAMTVQD